MSLLRTALYERHAALGARLVPFAGWEMPVQYEGVRAEHQAVRQSCGVFDVSHMGQIEVFGEQAQMFLQRLLTNDLEKLVPSGAQYSLLCQEQGGILDDLFAYCLKPNHYLIVTNAANHGKDFAWFKEHQEGFAVEVRDCQHDYAMLAVQGPDARKLLPKLVGDLLPPRMQVAEADFAGEKLLLCATGYTGEDGVELLVCPSQAGALWDALLEQGAVPCGLGARDTLRLEVCYHLYGNDMDETRNPIEAGLGWCCKEDTGFIGCSAVAASRQQGTAEKLVAFALDGAGIARSGNPVVGGGVITSGTLSPTLNYGIGMAYLPAEVANVGQTFKIDVRGRVRDAVVVEKPIYRKAN